MSRPPLFVFVLKEMDVEDLSGGNNTKQAGKQIAERWEQALRERRRSLNKKKFWNTSTDTRRETEDSNRGQKELEAASKIKGDEFSVDDQNLKTQTETTGDLVKNKASLFDSQRFIAFMCLAGWHGRLLINGVSRWRYKITLIGAMGFLAEIWKMKTSNRASTEKTKKIETIKQAQWQAFDENERILSKTIQVRNFSSERRDIVRHKVKKPDDYRELKHRNVSGNRLVQQQQQQ